MSLTEKHTSKLRVIAVPVEGGRLCTQFGHCEQFALLDLDTRQKKILNSRHIDPPPHQPGLLPRWLHEQGVNLVIVGGTGQRAHGILAQQGIDIIVGAPAESPDSLAQSYLDGTLQAGENTWDH